MKKVIVSEVANAILRQKLPPKLKDQGSFTIPCIIGDKTFNKCLLDLGASIQLILYFVFATLDLGELKP